MGEQTESDQPNQQKPTQPKPANRNMHADRLRCEEILRQMRGVGIPASKKLVKACDDDTVAAIIAADENMQRRSINRLIDHSVDSKQRAKREGHATER
jgi:hypothetical protein